MNKYKSAIIALIYTAAFVIIPAVVDVLANQA